MECLRGGGKNSSYSPPELKKLKNSKACGLFAVYSSTSTSTFLLFARSKRLLRRFFALR